jgi:hypothetical protein
MLFYCGIERVPKWPMAGAPLHSEENTPAPNFHPFTALPLSLSPPGPPPFTAYNNNSNNNNNNNIVNLIARILIFPPQKLEKLLEFTLGEI